MPPRSTFATGVIRNLSTRIQTRRSAIYIGEICTEFIRLANSFKGRDSKDKRILNGDEPSKVVKKNKSNPEPNVRSVSNQNTAAYPTVKFVFNSGAEVHVVNDRNAFRTFRLNHITLNLVGENIKSQGCGEVLIEYGDCNQMILSNVHYIPQSLWCIHSTDAGYKDGLNTILVADSNVILNAEDKSIVGHKEGSSYMMDFAIIYPSVLDPPDVFKDATSGALSLRSVRVAREE